MKRRIWLWILAGIVTLLAICLGVFVDLGRKAAAVVARHEQTAAAKLVEFRGRSWQREPMFGSEAAGNRWDAFAAALDALDAIPQAELDEIPETHDEPGFNPDPEKLDAVFAKHKPSVDLLREACRRKILVPPYAYEQAFAMDLPYVSKAIKVARYLAGASRRSHELGRDAEAMELSMLASIVGQDQAVGGPLVNHLVLFVCEQHGQQAARSILESHSLTAKELESLSGAIDRIWGARPRFSEALELEDAMDRTGLAAALGPSRVGGVVPLGAMPRSWRYLFSRDLMLAEALNVLEEYFREGVALADLPPPGRLSAAEELTEKVLRTRNPMAAILLPSISRTFKRATHAEMRWNLLRTGVALARYRADQGAFPAKLDDLVPRYLPRVLPCPFSGKALSYSDGKVWSFGGDGDDDGGRPQVDVTEDDSDGDVVWTVRRK